MFPIGIYALEKYIGLDNIIIKGQSFLVLTYTLSISSSLDSCLESFHLLISMKSHPYLGTCKETCNDACDQKDPHLRGEVLVEHCCQLLYLPPAVSAAARTAHVLFHHKHIHFGPETKNPLEHNSVLSLSVTAANFN